MLILVDHRDRHLGAIAVRGHVTTHSSDLLVNEGAPRDMGTLIDIGQVLQLRLAEAGNSLAKAGETALQGQVVKTLLEVLDVFGDDWAQQHFGSVRKRELHPRSVVGNGDRHTAIEAAARGTGGNFTGMPRRATATSDFGSGRRESHDASEFYARFSPPVVSPDERVEPPVVVDQLFVGDAREMTDAQVADRSVALMITSPPYFAGKEYETEMGAGHVPSSYVEYIEMLREVFALCLRKLEPGGRMAINVANLGRKPYRSLSADVMGILQNDLGMLLRGEVVWQKAKGAGGSCAWGSYKSPQNPVLRDVTERVIIASKGRFDRAKKRAKREAEGLPHEPTIGTEEFLEATIDIWEIPSERATKVGHPAPFPVALPLRLIELYTYKDDLVLDPFIGSGTTAVAAAESGRHYVGFDTEPDYIALARERLGLE